MFTLTWQPPYDWQWMLKFLGDRAVAGIEIVTPTDYTRSFACQGYRGLIHVTPQLQAGKLVALCGEPLPEAPGYRCFPEPAAVAGADPLALKALGMPLKRAESLIHLAQSVVAGDFPSETPDDIDSAIKALQTRPGIGRWTANYFALRGWQAKDVFLADDYLIKQRFAGMTPAQIRRYAERWQPWRSYALLHIWYTDGWTPSVDGEITGI